jgi:hypothetical protein
MALHLSLLDPNILLILINHQRSFLHVKDKVSHPYKTTGVADDDD